MVLPFHKVGIAHLTCRLIAPTEEEFTDTLNAIPEEDMRRLFTKAAELGVGIEFNSDDMKYIDEEAVRRPYVIAKKCGCKFYPGSDAHHPDHLDCEMSRFEKAVNVLGLGEEDKFILK